MSYRYSCSTIDLFVQHSIRAYASHPLVPLALLSERRDSLTWNLSIALRGLRNYVI